MTDLSSSVRCLGLAAAISNTSPPPVLLHMGNVIERTQIGTQCVCVCVHVKHVCLSVTETRRAGARWNRKPRQTFTLEEFPGCKMCIATANGQRGGGREVWETFSRQVPGLMFRSRAGFNLSHRSPFFSRQNSSLFRKHIFHHYLQFACSQPDFIFKNPLRGSDASEREAGRGTNRSEILLLTYVCVHTNYQVACCGPLFAVFSRVVKNGVYSVTLNANSCLMAAISEARVGWKLERVRKHLKHPTKKLLTGYGSAPI